tara:strand:+ start:544 stop:1080 length:537 start_codon:yes stop_codon:yes gene_type:complete
MNIITDHSDYCITRDGMVYSMLSDKFLRPSISNCGYEIYTITDDWGVHTTVQTARLLLLAYCPVKDRDHLTAEHKNRQKLDNRLVNLEWLSRSDQQNNRRVRKDNTSGEKYVNMMKFSGMKNSWKDRWQFNKITNGISYNKTNQSLEKIICEKMIHIHTLILNKQIPHPHEYLETLRK